MVFKKLVRGARADEVICRSTIGVNVLALSLRLKACSQRANSTELQFVNSSVNCCSVLRVLRTNRAITVLVSLQPVCTKNGRGIIRAVTSESVV